MNVYIWEKYYPELCFTANTAGSTVLLKKVGSPTAVTLETSTDGENWSDYTINATTITLTNVGDKVYFRNKSTTDTGFSISDSKYYYFNMNGSISASGDVNYLLNKNSTTTIGNYCFCNLFNGCTSLTTAPKLPATTIGNYSYMSTFYGCTNLTTAPNLPATNTGDYSYSTMFSNCTNLEILPKLYATTLATQTYRMMFYGCSKIKLSTSQTGEYQTAYRIPTSGSGSDGGNSLFMMFTSTGGTFTGTPSINTTYYTSNTVV